MNNYYHIDYIFLSFLPRFHSFINPQFLKKYLIADMNHVLVGLVPFFSHIDKSYQILMTLTKVNGHTLSALLEVS